MLTKVAASVLPVILPAAPPGGICRRDGDSMISVLINICCTMRTKVGDERARCFDVDQENSNRANGVCKESCAHTNSCAVNDKIGVSHSICSNNDGRDHDKHNFNAPLAAEATLNLEIPIL